MLDVATGGALHDCAPLDRRSRQRAARQALENLAAKQAEKIKFLVLTCQRLEAALEEFRTLRPDSSLEGEVCDRIECIRPVLRAEVLAARKEQTPAVAQEDRLRRNVAAHVFSAIPLSPSRWSSKELRRAQKGILPTTASGWPAMPDSAIECSQLEALLVPTFQWDVTAPVFVPYVGVRHSLSESCPWRAPMGCPSCSTPVVGSAVGRSAILQVQAVVKRYIAVQAVRKASRFDIDWDSLSFVLTADAVGQSAMPSLAAVGVADASGSDSEQDVITHVASAVACAQPGAQPERELVEQDAAGENEGQEMPVSFVKRWRRLQPGDDTADARRSLAPNAATYDASAIDRAHGRGQQPERALEERGAACEDAGPEVPFAIVKRWRALGMASLVERGITDSVTLSACEEQLNNIALEPDTEMKAAIESEDVEKTMRHTWGAAQALNSATPGMNGDINQMNQMKAATESSDKESETITLDEEASDAAAVQSWPV